MIYGLLVLMCVIFIEMVYLLNMRQQLTSSMSCSKEAIAVLRSADMDDSEKEIVMRRNSLAIMKATMLFIAKITIVLLVLYGLYYMATHLSMVTEEEFVDTMLSLKMLAIISVFAMLYMSIRNGKRK